MICEQLLPRRKRAVLGFSTALGAFLSSARLLRALRGFLHVDIRERLESRPCGDLHLSQHPEAVTLPLMSGCQCLEC